MLNPAVLVLREMRKNAWEGPQIVHVSNRDREPPAFGPSVAPPKIFAQFALKLRSYPARTRGKRVAKTAIGGRRNALAAGKAAV